MYSTIGAMLISGVFLLAGAMKLRRPDGAAGLMRAYGVPDRVAAESARALAVGEIGIAGAMLFPPTRLVGGALAAATLIAFTIAIAAQLRQEQRPSCGCFGVIHAEIGWPLIARNLLLISLAALVIAA